MLHITLQYSYRNDIKEQNRLCTQSYSVSQRPSPKGLIIGLDRGMNWLTDQSQHVCRYQCRCRRKANRNKMNLTLTDVHTVRVVRSKWSSFFLLNLEVLRRFDEEADRHRFFYIFASCNSDRNVLIVNRFPSIIIILNAFFNEFTF